MRATLFHNEVRLALAAVLMALAAATAVDHYPRAAIAWRKRPICGFVGYAAAPVSVGTRAGVASKKSGFIRADPRTIPESPLARRIQERRARTRPAEVPRKRQVEEAEGRVEGGADVENLFR